MKKKLIALLNVELEHFEINAEVTDIVVYRPNDFTEFRTIIFTNKLLEIWTPYTMKEMLKLWDELKLQKGKWGELRLVDKL